MGGPLRRVRDGTTRVVMVHSECQLVHSGSNMVQPGCKMVPHGVRWSTPEGERGRPLKV